MLEAETVCRNGAETQQKEEGNIFSVLSGKFIICIKKYK
jgi:hypothetical protein